MNHNYESFLEWICMTNRKKISSKNVITNPLLEKIMLKGWISFYRPGSTRTAYVLEFEIQETVGISKSLQSYLKNHFGDAWKQKTMAYFLSNRINPIFGTVEYFRK